MNKMNIFIKKIFLRGRKLLNQSGTNNLLYLRRGKECRWKFIILIYNLGQRYTKTYFHGDEIELK